MSNSDNEKRKNERNGIANSGSNNDDNNNMCQEKKEEEDLPALKTVLTHQYNDLKTTS